jgi:hypothetical protein
VTCPLVSSNVQNWRNDAKLSTLHIPLDTLEHP